MYFTCSNAVGDHCSAMTLAIVGASSLGTGTIKTTAPERPLMVNTLRNASPSPKHAAFRTAAEDR